MKDATANGLTPAYLQLCRQHRQTIRQLFQPAPWDWILGPDGISRIGVSIRPLDEDEIVIPRLERLIRQLRQHTKVVVIDCLPQDFACLAFDDDGSTLANVVAGDPEEAAFRALLLLASGRAGNSR